MPEIKTQPKTDNNDVFSGIDNVVAAPPIPALVKTSVINDEAEKIRKARELPKKPGENVTFSELQDWLRILTPDMWPRIMIYVYRLEPVINRQFVDPQSANNIDVIGDGFNELSEEYFVSRHGGGKYKLVICDLDNTRINKGGFFNASLTVSMLENPPKLDLREVEWENQKNRGYRSWARSQKLIDENNMPMPEKKVSEPAANGDAMVQAMKLAMDFASKMDDKQQTQLKRQLGGEDAVAKSMGEIMLEKMKQDDPNKMISTLATLMGAMKSMQSTPAANNDILATIIPMFTSMMAAMQESSKQTFAMLMEIIKSNKSESTGEGRDEISRLKDLVEVARELKGGGAIKERSTAEVITEFAAPIIGPLLNVVGQVMAIRAQGAAEQPKMKGQVVEMPKTNIDETPVMPGQPQSNARAELPAANPGESAQIIRQFAPIILNKLSGEGWEFGAWISEGFGEMTAVAVTRYGVEGLMAAAKTVPEFWNQIMTTYGEEHLRKWLTSFVNFKEEIAKMEAEGDDNVTS